MEGKQHFRPIAHDVNSINNLKDKDYRQHVYKEKHTKIINQYHNLVTCLFHLIKYQSQFYVSVNIKVIFKRTAYGKFLTSVDEYTEEKLFNESGRTITIKKHMVKNGQYNSNKTFLVDLRLRWMDL